MTEHNVTDFVTLRLKKIFKIKTAQVKFATVFSPILKAVLPYKWTPCEQFSMCFSLLCATFFFLRWQHPLSPPGLFRFFLQLLVIYFGISLSVRNRYKSPSGQPLISWLGYAGNRFFFFFSLILALSFLTSSCREWLGRRGGQRQNAQLSEWQKGESKAKLWNP